MVSILKSEYLSILFRYTVGIFFIYASLSKLPYPAQFAVNLANYQLIPYWAVNSVAVIVPWLEMVCGLFLLLGLWTRAAASLIVLQLIIMNIMIGINLFIGAPPIPCGCTDTLGEPISWWMITKNTGWLLITLQVFFFDRLWLQRMGGMFRKRLSGI
jgi:putative oxidoreductase